MQEKCAASAVKGHAHNAPSQPQCRVSRPRVCCSSVTPRTTCLYLSVLYIHDLYIHEPYIIPLPGYYNSTCKGGTVQRGLVFRENHFNTQPHYNPRSPASRTILQLRRKAAHIVAAPVVTPFRANAVFRMHSDWCHCGHPVGRHPSAQFSCLDWHREYNSPRPAKMDTCA